MDARGGKSRGLADSAATRRALRENRQTLAERVKELKCLFAAARLCGAPHLMPAKILPSLCTELKAAFQHPARTGIRIRARGHDVQTPGCRDSATRLRSAVHVRGSEDGFVDAFYQGVVPAGSAPFLPTERKLLDAVAQLVAQMLDRAESESEAARSAKRLYEQKRQLERTNIALREVLGYIEIEKKQIRDQIAADMDRSIRPLLRALSRPGLGPGERSRYAALAWTALRDMVAVGARAALVAQAGLSPREAEIASLVKRGATSKEIARMLHVAEATVERHRHNIRRKTGIGGRKVNLVTFLSEGEGLPRARTAARAGSCP